MDRVQLEEVLYQAMETERGGELVYWAAIDAAVHDEV